MKLLYVTANVLGDPGANAAEIFPRMAVDAPQVRPVIVADYARNREFIETRQGAEFLLLPDRAWRLPRALSDARRIARCAKVRDVDIIHIFYRRQNALMLIFLRLALMWIGARAVLLMDHRSVNLTRGPRALMKLSLNLLMQGFAHRLAGNPLAVESNHPIRFRPSDIIDLGYENLPSREGRADPDGPCAIWFIGSLEHANRKSEFLLEVFERIAAQRPALTRPVQIHVAGPARPDQETALRANPMVTYHGRLERDALYTLLRAHPGVGVAFMNQQFHGAAPSLKFAEYGLMRYAIVASDTRGLRLQGTRMNLPGVQYVAEDPQIWVQTLLTTANGWKDLAPVWEDAHLWSYKSIYERQVLGLYGRLLG